MAELFTSASLFAIVLTLGAYEFGIWLQKKLKSPICNPILIAVILVIAAISLLKIPAQDYKAGCETFSWLLTPATVCLAVPLYEQVKVLKKNLPAILVGVLAALLLKSTVFKGEAVPFVMELPNYRLPGLKNVAQLLWEKARDFLQKAFTVIFAATIVIWFLQNFDVRLNMVADSQDSILAFLAGAVAPLFAPLGLADWKLSTALISGFMAKESVVSTLTVLYGTEEALSSILTPGMALTFLTFCLLYTPCIAAITSVKRENGTGWAVGMIAFQCVVAWIAAFAVHLMLSAFGVA